MCIAKASMSSSDPILSLNINFGKPFIHTVKILLDTSYLISVYQCKPGN